MKLFLLNRDDIRLVFNLTGMQLRDRYLGSFLGILWVIFQPIIFLGMYTFVFGFVLKSKAPGSEQSLSYVVWLLSGLVPYMAFSEALIYSANSVISNSQMVKNIVFKTEILPCAAVLMSLVPFCVGMIFLFGVIFMDAGHLTWRIVLLIPLTLLQFAFVTGLGLFLAAVTVFVRDITQILPTLTTLWLFFTPVFYPRDMTPKAVQLLTQINPLYHLTQSYRDILVGHSYPNLWGVIYLSTLSFVLITGGLQFFRRLKGYFEMCL